MFVFKATIKFTSLVKLSIAVSLCDLDQEVESCISLTEEKKKHTHTGTQDRIIQYELK